MMPKTWTQRVGVLLAAASLLAVLASQVARAKPTTVLPAGDGFVYINSSVIATALGFTPTPSGTREKCINIDPAATTTSWFFFRAPAAITITGIDCIVDAATSVVMTLRECDGNGANCGDTEGAITCAATNTTESGAIADTAVDSGDWMRITRGDVTGSPTQAVMCVTYTEP